MERREERDLHPGWGRRARSGGRGEEGRDGRTGVLKVDLAQIGGLVGGREVPEQAAQSVDTAGLDLGGGGNVGCYGEEAGECQHLGRKQLVECGKAVIAFLLLLPLVLR